jgi:inner membrane protein
MDAVTHAIIGVAVGGLSGHPITMQDPVYIASVLGSQAPDFDLIVRLRGKMAFLKAHRAFSHSLPGVLMWSSLITAGLYLFSPGSALAEVFFWSFLGGLSHIIMDFLNTHGASVLWPVRLERKSLNLLNVFDPLLSALLLGLYFYHLPVRHLAAASFAIIVLYTAGRYVLKYRALLRLRNHFGEQNIRDILVMPCLSGIYHWDFLVTAENAYYLGHISSLQRTISITTELPKQTASPLTLEAKKSNLGRFFSRFTPFSYFEEYETEDMTTIHIYDLRYYVKTRFLHSGTIVFRGDKTPSHAYIQSYGDTIHIQC